MDDVRMVATEVLFTLFFLFTREYLTRVSAAVIFVVVTLIYVPCALLQINNLAVISEPQTTEAVVVEKYHSSGSRENRKYTLSVTAYAFSSKDFYVDVQEYDATEVGDAVTVEISEGPLGIRYAEIHSSDDANSPALASSIAD